MAQRTTPRACTVHVRTDAGVELQVVFGIGPQRATTLAQCAGLAAASTAEALFSTLGSQATTVSMQEVQCGSTLAVLR